MQSVGLRTLAVLLTVRPRLRVMGKKMNQNQQRCCWEHWKKYKVCFNSGQYQIIFGTGTVNKIYDEVVAPWLTNIIKRWNERKPLNKETGSNARSVPFGDVFVPILPAIVATGLFYEGFVVPLLKTRFWLCLVQQQTHLNLLILYIFNNFNWYRVCLLPSLDFMVCVPSIRRKSCSWDCKWFDDGWSDTSKCVGCSGRSF